MRKKVMILGTLLIATILISNPVIATEIYIARVEDFEDCTNEDEAIGEPDNTYAIIGVNNTLGWILLDFGFGVGMDPDSDFTIYGMSDGLNETYSVAVRNQDGLFHTPVGNGWDVADLVFTTPSYPSEESWRYVYINGTSGGKEEGDMNYGPEIDAVVYEL